MEIEECTAVSIYKKGSCVRSLARRLWRALFRLSDTRLRHPYTEQQASVRRLAMHY